jgi:arylsulfatase
MQQVVGQWLSTFREFPPRQPTASFTIDKMIRGMQQQMEMAKRKAGMTQK